MNGIRNVVTGVDFSESSLLALQYSAELAVRHSAKLWVVHACEETPIAAMPLTQPMGDGELRGLLDARVEEVIARSHIDRRILDMEIRLMPPRPAQALLDATVALEEPVIVVGHRGKGMLERLFLGSVAADVVRNARHPVLVIRRRRNALPKHVLAAVDFSPLAPKVLRTAYDWASRAHAGLTVLHVMPFPPVIDGYMVGPSIVGSPHLDEPVDEEATKGRLRELVDETLGSGCDVGIEVRQGVSDVEIHYVADVVGADLTVVGCNGHRGLSSLILGNTAVRILQDAVSSVLVVRPDERQ